MVLKTDFQRSDENSQDPLNENFRKINDYINDTGWVDIPAINNFTWLKQLQARRIGKEVRLRGTLSPTGSVDIKNPFCILPVEFRHNWDELYRFDTPVASANVTLGSRIYIKNNGEMTVTGQSDTGVRTIFDGISFLVD